MRTFNSFALKELQEKLGEFPEKVKSYARELLTRQEWKDRMILMNVENMQKGLRPDNTDIQKRPVGKQKSNKYERYTIYLKEKRGQEFNPDIVTLEDTGQFRRSIEVKIGSDTIYFIDNDAKAEMIEATWGAVLGITEEQINILSEMMLPYVEDYAVKYFKSQR